MGNLLASIDYSPASIRALEASLRLRQLTGDRVVLYHAYQLPKGLPFLSAHVIEGMEVEAQRAAQERLRRFLSETLPPTEARRIRIIIQREFLTEGLSQQLRARRYSLLALGARGESTEDGERIGFHARHFVYHSSVPLLLTFPKTEVRWQRLLFAYEPTFRSSVGLRTLRQIIQKLSLPVVGLPLLKMNPTADRFHKSILKATRASHYQPLRWEGSHLVRLLIQAARSYQADVIGFYAHPQEVITGMQALSEAELEEGAGWLFFPPLSDEG
ncbi:MAG: universal stress protein [Bacteroidia bacterium]|nr:universal stress protein [Bacteroidia bacterium]MDW8015207.1 universal stress protein [Bacteroidia bacterium]